jgi:glycerol-3-phosphate acyltransferase PlsY
MPESVIIAYFVGSIPFALLLARRWGGSDLRLVGSGNLGAANVMRASGLTPGILVALLDMSKGMASVLIAERLTTAGHVPAVAGLAAIVGHIYPVWLGFRGGKGVATACGVFAVLSPMAALAALGVFLVCVWLTRYVSLGSVLGSTALPPVAYATGQATSVVVAGIAAAALIVFRHRSNLVRLRHGSERRLSRAHR